MTLIVAFSFGRGSAANARALRLRPIGAIWAGMVDVPGPPLATPEHASEEGVFKMTGDDNDYSEAFGKAKLEHDQREQGSTEAKRLQAEADADSAVLSDVVLPQLKAADQKLNPLGGKVEIRQYNRTGKTLRPTSVAFRITDHHGLERPHESRAYLIVPRGGEVIVTAGDGFDVTSQPRQPKNVSAEIGIQRRDDLTIENVKKLIMRAIEEYRNDRDPPGAQIKTIT